MHSRVAVETPGLARAFFLLVPNARVVGEKGLRGFGVALARGTEFFDFLDKRMLLNSFLRGGFPLVLRSVCYNNKQCE